jgi:tRNA threonylcarbamoyladenosine biosynthesis protein TsaB
MRVVAIDAATRRATIALWEDGRTVASRASEQPEHHAERLLGLLQAAFADAGWARTGIDLVACGIGPGSFTGIRVGMASAKGLALAWSIPLVGVGSLEAMAAALPAGQPLDGVVALLDAKKREAYFAVYDPAGAVLVPPSHVPLDRIAEQLAPLQGRRLVAVGEATALIDLAGTLAYRSPETDLPDARTIARLGAMRVASRGTDDLASLEPLYVRPPDITMPRQL